MPIHKLLPVFMIAAAGTVAAQPSPSLSVPGISAERNFSGARTSAALEAQVRLDHSGHSPGVIDGALGGNTRRAILAFQRANGMTTDGQLSAALLDKLRGVHSGDQLQRYTITAEDVAGPFVQVPDAMEDQAKLETLGYESPAEGIAEKFHMAQSS